MTDQTTWKSMEKAFHIAIKGHLNVRHQAYVMGKLREIMQVPFDEQAREIASLRNIISECATACGAAVSVECSEEFMAMLPDEIRTVMTGKTREIEGLEADLESANNWDISQLKVIHTLNEELAVLKAQPNGVVDAQRLLDWNRSQPEPRPIVVGREYQVVEACARLNQPASAGDSCMCGGNPHTTQCLYEHFLSYSGLADQPLLRYAYFHGAGFAAEIDQPSAGGVDERAAFVGRFSKVYDLDFDEETDEYKDPGDQALWYGWQARAALSASHSEQVRAVPVEPTEAMRKAAQDKLASEGLIVTDWLIHTAYSAMLAAATSAGSQKEQGE